jgi:branched-chain amino acid transport system substrate-binding protein
LCFGHSYTEEGGCNGKYSPHAGEELSWDGWQKEKRTMSERKIHGQSKGVSLALSLILVFCGACGSQSTTTEGQATTPIKIGIALSLSGDFAADGRAFEQGYQLWADEINAHGGLLGRQVKLNIVDDGSSPDTVQLAYQKLITGDKVDLVFGPFSTQQTKPASLVASQYGYAMLEGAGGGPSVFNRGLHNVFDVSLPVANALVSFTHYLLSLPVSKRPTTAAYATEDDPFTQPQVERARVLLEQGGMKTLSFQTYALSTTTNYNVIADTIAISHAQVVVWGTELPDSSAFIEHFKLLHYNPRMLIATAGPDQGNVFLKAIGGAATAEGILFPNAWYPQLKVPGNAEMIKAYLAKYKGTPDEISADIAEAYSVGQVTFQAVTKIKGLDNAKLLTELHSGATFQSVQGPVKFDATGQNILAQAYLSQWQRGAYLPVYPPSAAMATPEFPKPNWP